MYFQIEGCKRKEDGRFYIGKRCVYVYKTKNRRCVPQHPKIKTRLQAVWGKVIRVHGNNGAVRAKFRKNLPGHAMGHRVRIVSVVWTVYVLVNFLPSLISSLADAVPVVDLNHNDLLV